MRERIQTLSRQYLAEITAIRRHLHAHPELSFEEFETSAFVCKKLEAAGIPYKTGFVKTGISAIIEGKNPTKKVVALRGDMDALPIHEKNNVSYKSVNDGVMHACGHDVHTACLLGAAMILQELRNEFEGTVKLIFQPGEEKLPGGASLMISEGILKDPDVDLIIGQHVFPVMEAGNVGFRQGMYMASSDEIYITVTGKGGHAALPSSYNNPVMIASELLLDMRRIMDKNLPEGVASVLAFGKFIAEGATNVIPDEVKIEGTLRTMNEEWRKEAHQIIRYRAQQMAEKHAASCTVTIVHGYPVLYNNEQVTATCEKAAKEFLGEANVHGLELRMTAEDFAWYSREVPACFYRLGTGSISKGITSNVHTATFDIDEQALETGMGLMAFLAISNLGS